MPRFMLTLAVALLLPAWAGAQLLPRTGAAVDVLGGAVDSVTGNALERLPVIDAAERLVAARTHRLADFVRVNGNAVALDDRGQPAVRGTVLVMGGDAAALDALRAAGYALASEHIEGLELAVTRVAVPEGESLARTIRRVRKLAPGAQVSGDTLYFASGSAAAVAGDAVLASKAGGGQAVGLIDGGVARHPALSGAIEQRGFARGAPSPSGHGTAVASLIVGTGRIRGAAPRVPLLVADIYGRDPAGGGAFALARALGWMAARGVGVVTVSLVGPENPLLAGAVRIARQKGVTVVAAVGNDGPAAPPAYPASYPGVLAVTGVDARDRGLVEAGRALHLDFAAPGADMVAADPGGGVRKVRGTSFAAPLVAGRLHKVGGIDALVAEAKDMGRKGTDSVYGRGIVCRSCRTVR